VTDAHSVERKLAAILSADVEGYGRLMGDDEVGTVRTITTYRDAIASAVARHAGRIVDSTGDNVLAEFSSVVDAVQCAVEIQRELRSRNDALPGSRRMRFRIGINLGDVIVEGQRIYGDGVNTAARVEAWRRAEASASPARRTIKWRGSSRSATTSSASIPSRTSRDRCACTGSGSSPAPRAWRRLGDRAAGDGGCTRWS